MRIPTPPPADGQQPPDESMIAPEGQPPEQDSVQLKMPKELLAQLASIFQVPEGQDHGDEVSITIPKSDLDQLVEILSAASQKAQGDIDAQGGADLSGLGDELNGMRDGMNR